jgi:hypothetical protein
VRADGTAAETERRLTETYAPKVSTTSTSSNTAGAGERLAEERHDEMLECFRWIAKRLDAMDARLSCVRCMTPDHPAAVAATAGLRCPRAASQ